MHEYIHVHAQIYNYIIIYVPVIIHTRLIYKNHHLLYQEPACMGHNQSLLLSIPLKAPLKSCQGNSGVYVLCLYT